MPAAKKSTTAGFEKSLNELEKIVERMEQGEQSLDDTLKDFERGMMLSEQCQKGLDEAQQKVEKLVKKHGGYSLEPFEDETPEDDQ